MSRVIRTSLWQDGRRAGLYLRKSRLAVPATEAVPRSRGKLISARIAPRSLRILKGPSI